MALSRSPEEVLELTERQRSVLRALVASYVSGAAPVGSGTISDLLSIRLSPASVRNTLGELAGLGLIQKPHASSGRVPTEEGIRHFVDRLLAPGQVGQYERRSLDRSFESVHAAHTVQLASQVLSDHTRQLGFVVAPRIERIALQHISFVRLAADRVLAVLVDASGRTHQRVIENPIEGVGLDQAELDRMAAALNERVVGCTLRELRDLLESEVRSLRNRASRLLENALRLGLRAAKAAIETPTARDLFIATRLALMEQPEFSDPERLRDLFGALEQGERLVEILEELIEGDGVSVALGEELDTHGLLGCALVAAPYGDSAGLLGVIGPTRMDYGRIIPLVGYCSQLVTDKLSQ